MLWVLGDPPPSKEPSPVTYTSLAWNLSSELFFPCNPVPSASVPPLYLSGVSGCSKLLLAADKLESRPAQSVAGRRTKNEALYTAASFWPPSADATSSRPRDGTLIFRTTALARGPFRHCTSSGQESPAPCARSPCAGASSGQESSAPCTAAPATVAQVPAGWQRISCPVNHCCRNRCAGASGLATNLLPRALAVLVQVPAAGKNPLPHAPLLPQPLHRCQRRTRIPCPVRCCRNRCTGASGGRESSAPCTTAAVTVAQVPAGWQRISCPVRSQPLRRCQRAGKNLLPRVLLSGGPESPAPFAAAAIVDLVQAAGKNPLPRALLPQLLLCC